MSWACGAGRCWAVIGGGDAAFDYSLSLADGQGQVFLLCRGERISALERLQKEVTRRSAAITLWTNTELVTIKAGVRKPLALVLSSLAFNYIGDGLRDALDPRLKM